MHLPLLSGSLLIHNDFGARQPSVAGLEQPARAFSARGLKNFER
jgi:hypothetical protein